MLIDSSYKIITYSFFNWNPTNSMKIKLLPYLGVAVRADVSFDGDPCNTSGVTSALLAFGGWRGYGKGDGEGEGLRYRPPVPSLTL